MRVCRPEGVLPADNYAHACLRRRQSSAGEITWRGCIAGKAQVVVEVV
jgi:hypothetical protein